MDSRIVAIVLGLLVLLTGFLVIQEIRERQDGIPDVLDGVECRTRGSCMPAADCAGSAQTVDCPDGEVCCVEQP